VIFLRIRWPAPRVDGVCRACTYISISRHLACSNGNAACNIMLGWAYGDALVFIRWAVDHRYTHMWLGVELMRPRSLHRRKRNFVAMIGFFIQHTASRAKEVFAKALDNERARMGIELISPSVALAKR
jgi:hypothetical protein